MAVGSSPTTPTTLSAYVYLKIMRKMTKAARRLIISLIGFPLFLLGLVLIPLPGPGLVITFLALLILATEYSWADSHKRRAKEQFRKIYDTAKARADKIENYSQKPKDK